MVLNYIQVIPKDPTIVTPVTLLYRDIHTIFTNYQEHLMLEDVCSESPHRPWSMVYSCI